MPHFTPPAPYSLEDNPNSLLDLTDLVFIDPVGTGYSAAIAPGKNGDFWGVDEDARSIKQFIKRYLTAFNRWNSPKFLFGESYGTPRTCVLTWLLHEDGVDLNGIVLQSSILDYSQVGNTIGLLPTLAADAWFHKKVTVSPPPTDLPSFMTTGAGDLAAAMALNPYLKVFSANGYYDAVTPFFQTILNFESMPLVDSHAQGNLTVRNYPSGHMIYLDNDSRTAMKADLAQFYQSTRPELVEKAHLNRSRGVRRFSRTPY